ncbi:MAG: pirin family protein [Chloroflexota bacterium]
MGTIRRIDQVWKSQPTLEGAGVHLRRAFGNRHAPQLDPFLLLDDFHSDNPEHYRKGFPWHPHRGIETITYMLHGEVEHGDSLGNQGVIHPGEVQWMTAGSGIIHQEMPTGDSLGRMWGLQLWANLPAAYKMMAPRYRDVRSEQIPEVSLSDGGRVRVVCGEVNGVRGPVQDVVVDPQYLDVSLLPGTCFAHHIPAGYTAFAYVLEGAGYFSPERTCEEREQKPVLPGADLSQEEGQEELIDAENLVIFGDGDEINVATGVQGLRFLLVSGKPIGEPVAWYGPIVMNTQEELQTAFDEYRRGTFLKHQTG